MDEVKSKAKEVSQFLKGLSNPQRLMILCLLIEKEHSVTELIEAINIPQTSMSQHLSKLKKDGLVDFRRDHRTLYYFIKDKSVIRVMTVLHEIFCSSKES